MPLWPEVKRHDGDILFDRPQESCLGLQPRHSNMTEVANDVRQGPMPCRSGRGRPQFSRVLAGRVCGDDDSVERGRWQLSDREGALDAVERDARRHRLISVVVDGAHEPAIHRDGGRALSLAGVPHPG